MTVHSAREREVTTIPVDEVFRAGVAEIYPEVLQRQYFDVRLKGDRLLLTAGKFVGLIPLNRRVAIHVQPKMPVTNMLRMLSVASGNVRSIDLIKRRYPWDATQPRSIFEALARAFAVSIRLIMTEGLRKQYLEATSDGPFLKGRLDIGRSIPRFWSRGESYQAVMHHFDLLADLPENRILRTACRLLLINLMSTDLNTDDRADIADCEELLADSGVGQSSTADFQSIPRDMSPDYAKAVELARALILNQGVDLEDDDGNIDLPSFLIDMETLFENYVRTILRTMMRGSIVKGEQEGGGKPLFDDRQEPPANPDFVILANGSYILVGDVKYKAKPDRQDLNQVITYALSYGVNVAILVAPSDTSLSENLVHLGTIKNVRVYQYRLWLSSESIEAEERKLTETMVSLTSHSQTTP